MKVIIPLAEGFEEIEFVTVADILRRANLEVVIAGLKDGPINGAHGIKMMPDLTLDKIKAEDFDALVLPGGAPGFVNLGNDKRVLELIREMDRTGKYVFAICAAPSVLIKAGILKGRKATVSPSGKAQMAACTQYVDERVAVAGKLVTSQSPGNAMEFALKLVEILAGAEEMRKIKAQTLAICKGD